MRTITKTSQTIEIEADRLEIIKNMDRYDSLEDFTLSFGEGNNVVNIILNESFFKLLQEEISKIK
jgi:hypothetical protein